MSTIIISENKLLYSHPNSGSKSSQIHVSGNSFLIFTSEPTLTETSSMTTPSTCTSSYRIKAVRVS